MKVLLLKDVYKLGRAGDIKKVADGYGRNFLLPQGLALMATPGAIQQAERIRRVATEERVRLNQELGAVAERLSGLQVVFPAKAGETGKLYGSITHQMIAEAIEKAVGVKVERRQIDCQPVKTLGVHKARIRLTVDLIPEVQVVVHREGEPVESAFEQPLAAPIVIEAGDELDEGEPEPEAAAASEIETEAETED